MINEVVKAVNAMVAGWVKKEPKADWSAVPMLAEDLSNLAEVKRAVVLLTKGFVGLDVAPAGAEKLAFCLKLRDLLKTLEHAAAMAKELASHRRASKKQSKRKPQKNKVKPELTIGFLAAELNGIVSFLQRYKAGSFPVMTMTLASLNQHQCELSRLDPTIKSVSILAAWYKVIILSLEFLRRSRELCAVLPGKVKLYTEKVKIWQSHETSLSRQAATVRAARARSRSAVPRRKGPRKTAW